MEQKEEKLEKKLKEDNIKKFDFTKIELDYIVRNANFNNLQQNIFNRLTDRNGRQTIARISIEENISESTVSRTIKQIKRKILKII